MQRVIPFLSFMLTLLLVSFLSFPAFAAPKASPSEEVAFKGRVLGLDKKVLQLALRAYQNSLRQGLVRGGVITVIDYSKPSDQRRLWVLDLQKNKVLYSLHVAHGMNSGGRVPTNFSNTMHSRTSSIGAFRTDNTYVGKHGYSLRLDGLERGINDKARARAIVIHAADYATPHFAKRFGMLGRSWGCPAIDPRYAKEVIDVIKNGSFLFAYYPHKNWLQASRFITRSVQG